MYCSMWSAVDVVNSQKQLARNRVHRSKEAITLH